MSLKKNERKTSEQWKKVFDRYTKLHIDDIIKENENLHEKIYLYQERIEELERIIQYLLKKSSSRSRASRLICIADVFSDCPVEFL